MNELKEKDIQANILEYLQLKKIFCWRNNSGMMLREYKGRQYAQLMGPKGSPDIIGVLPNGKFFGIEVKKPGKKPTKSQEEFLDKIKAENGIAFIATSIDDVQEQLGI